MKVLRAHEIGLNFGANGLVEVGKASGASQQKVKQKHTQAEKCERKAPFKVMPSLRKS